MKKIRAAIIGYGNIGKYVLEAIDASSDFVLAGVVRRDPNDVPPELLGRNVVGSIEELSNVDVALMCLPSRNVKEQAKKILSLGINTVDSFDIHSEIVELRTALNKVASQSNSVAVISSGWDPGSDSMVRAMFEICAPKGITHTNFGPGMSMGHTVAVKAIAGVKNALSMTVPMGTGVHRRMVYIELEAGYDFDKVAQTIKSDGYFINDETHVKQVECVDSLKDMGHGVNLVRRGVSGATQNQFQEYNMRADNPAITSQIMVSTARAAMHQKAGAYTMIEIPLIDFLLGDRDDIIHRLV